MAPLEPDRPAVAGTAFASLRTMSAQETTITRLVVTCDDRPGIVSAVSTFLHEHGANILHIAVDAESGGEVVNEAAGRCLTEDVVVADFGQTRDSPG